MISLYIQKDDYTSDVIDYTLSFAPLVICCSHKSFCRALCISLFEEREYDISNSLVIKEFPNTITCQNHYFVIRFQIEHFDLGYSIHANPASR